VSELERATRTRHVVRFRYLSDPPRTWRWVEPHVLFESRGAKLLLDGVQIAGYSSQVPVAFPVWRQFDVAMIAEVEVLAERFEPDDGLRLDSSKYVRVISAAVG
jgi:hypothetical protein